MKNSKFSIFFLVIGAIFNINAIIISFFGVWLLLFALICFVIGTVFILLTNLKLKVKALIILVTLLAMSIPTIYYVWKVYNI